MTWSTSGNDRGGKYSSLPSQTAQSLVSSGGAIELPSIRNGDGEECNNYDVYSVYVPDQSKLWVLVIVSIVAVVVVSLIVLANPGHNELKQSSLDNIEFPSNELFGNAFRGDAYMIKSEDISPPYDIHVDFRNKLGKVPPYWEEIEHLLKSTSGPFNVTSWGPCYHPVEENGWREKVVLETHNRFNNDNIVYPKAPRGDSVSNPLSSFYSGNNDLQLNNKLAGLCRPGFLIVGQAKCGTSSLYHYLIGHPRVLPATQKQINYFKYLAYMPMEWYLSNFPSIQSFLARGALMTGESSPSYFPYPQVPHLIYERTKAENQSHPKIIAIVRHPIDRSVSSYKYNYVAPALKLLLNRPKNSKIKAALNIIPEGMSEEYYIEHHLFSFEELVRAEINVLKECLSVGGVAEQMSREKYGPPNGMYADDFRDSKIPLVNADEFCYGNTVNDTIPLAQWADLIKQNPDKVMVGLDYHLIRSIVGRSLYSLFLNWWYTRFSRNDLYIVCTEDLRFKPAETMLDVSLFLGLPEFDFREITDEGMYNVGFHQGYDTVTKWDDIEKEGNGENYHDESDSLSNDIEVSEELQNELLEFFRPYNQELFHLIGKSCQWG